jgi:uncharacterized protein YceK
MRSRIYAAFILLAFVLFLSGCRTTLVVHDATTQKIIPIFKDYVGTHGYRLAYQNEQTGSYHVDMGTVFMPYTSSTEKSKSTIQYNPSGSGQPMTAYEETSWNTVANPAHFEQATAAVTIVQQGKDVMVLIDTNDAGGSSFNDISNYLKSLGYSVENR